MKINAIDKLGNLKEYDAILTYHSDEFNKDYAAYTDNTYNSNNELQIYISEYNSQDSECLVKPIPEDEYNKIKTEINSILLTLKNENDKIEFNENIMKNSRREKIMNMKEIQKEIWQNKLNKGFNTTDVNKEFCLLYGEVAEAYDAYRKKKDDLNEELADIAIYLMGLSEMLGFDLETEILKKVDKNGKRVYKNIDGVNVRVSD